MHDSSEVLKTLVFIKKQIPTRDQRWYSVRIMPYRTQEDRIDGLVITLFNITDMKQMEDKLNENENMRQFIMNSSSDLIIRMSSDLNCLEFNTEVEKTFEIKLKDAINQNFIHLFIPEQNQKRTEKEFNRLIKEGIVSKLKLEMAKSNNTSIELEWSINILKNNLKTGNEMILMVHKSSKDRHSG